MQELPTIQAPSRSGLSEAEIAALTEETRELAAQRNAVILAHNYQLPELQDIADFVGCLLYTSPSPRDGLLSRMPSSA